MKAYVEALEKSKYGSLWHDLAARPDDQPPLSADTECELLIVGGGFTGLWAALQVKERQPDTDVILIDKTFVGDGASGRCGGFLNSSLAHGESNTDYHFPGEADQLHALGQENMIQFLETLKRYDIDVDYEPVGELDVATNQHAVDAMRSAYEEEKRKGHDVVWFDQTAMQAQVNSPTYLAGLLRKNGMDGVINPAKLCWGLKAVILNMGVRIFENTQYLSVQPEGKDNMKTLCSGGTIRSKKILMATNGFHSTLRKIRKSVIPVWDYQIATEPLTEAQLETIGWHKSRHAIGNYANMFHYYRLTKDNRITWGGGGAVRYYFNNNTGEECADITERFQQLSKEFFETFPQLAGVKFSHRWGGIIATSTRFCMVPGMTYNGRVAWSVGYTGLGVGATRFGARVGIELLGYQPSDILKMKFVTKKALSWVPEPFRWLGVKITQKALIRADKNNGKRGLWLKLLDYLNLGFTC